VKVGKEAVFLRIEELCQVARLFRSSLPAIWNSSIRHHKFDKFVVQVRMYSSRHKLGGNGLWGRDW